MDDNNLKQNEDIQDTAENTVEEAVAQEATDESVDDVAVQNGETSEDSSEKTPSETSEDAASDEESAPEPEAQTEDSEEKPVKKSAKDLKGKWYIVHTYSGHENKVGKTLMQRVQSMGYEDRIYDAIVPTRETIRIRSGKKEKVKEKIFPGYILVNMDLTDESWILVRTTPGVTSFVGAENKPTPIRDDEVAAIIEFVDRKEPVYKAQFSVGEAVKINDGPFSDFLGTVESIDQEKGKIKVLVSIFGRETPVELDFLQVTKI